eukprot:524879-Pelagomonas_calceolata.AAC.3
MVLAMDLCSMRMMTCVREPELARSTTLCSLEAVTFTDLSVYRTFVKASHCCINKVYLPKEVCCMRVIILIKPPRVVLKELCSIMNVVFHEEWLPKEVQHALMICVRAAAYAHA